MDSKKELQRLARIGVNISTEFNSPLSILVATLEEFERHETNQAKRLQLNVALRNAYKFRSLTRDIFSLAKLIDGDVLYRMIKTNVVSYSETILKSFSPAAAEKNVILEFKSSVDQLECFIDFQKLHRIVYRLIANGIRFMKAEGGIVRLSLYYLKEQNKIQIEIWDNGIGIVPEKVPHIFDLYYEKDPIHLMYYQGTSIGLYLTKYLVESLQGTISVESEKFSHTRFLVTLPCFSTKKSIPFKHVEIFEDINYEQLAMMEEVMEIDTDEILEVRLPKEKTPLVVVMAEDEYEPFWREVWKNNAQLLFINSIDGALGKSLEIVPDLIVIQKNIDNTSGIEALKFLRKNGVVSHVPMALFSGTTAIKHKDLVAAQADAIVYKTEDPEQTYLLLTNVIENRKKVYQAAYQDAIKAFKQSKSLSLEESFLAKINGLLDKNLADEHFGVEQLSKEMYMSRTQIHRKLKAITTMSTTQYIKHYKIKKAYQDLKAHTGTISQIAYRYGFSSPAYFSRIFHEIHGFSPSEVANH